MTDTEAQCLLATPLREISKSAIGSYAEFVFLTIGSVVDFRYFLPRILETAALTRDMWPSPEIVLYRLSQAKWLNWSVSEKSAIMQLVDEWFKTELAHQARYVRDDGSAYYSWDGDALLCGMARAEMDLTPFFEEITRPEWREQLAGLYGSNFDDDTQQVYLGNAFWRDDEAKGEALLAFLRRPEINAMVLDEMTRPR